MDHHIRLISFNLASWTTTVISMEFLKDLAQLAALGGSVMVSMASFWWICKQAKALDAKNKDSK